MRKKPTTKADLAAQVEVLKAEVELLKMLPNLLENEVAGLRAEVADLKDRMDDELATRVVEITVDAVIERLRRDHEMPRRSRLEWELLLAPVCAWGRSGRMLASEFKGLQTEGEHRIGNAE
jgi:hypothetical protein